MPSPTVFTAWRTVLRMILKPHLGREGYMQAMNLLSQHLTIFFLLRAFWFCFCRAFGWNNYELEDMDLGCVTMNMGHTQLLRSPVITSEKWWWWWIYWTLTLWLIHTISFKPYNNLLEEGLLYHCPHWHRKTWKHTQRNCPSHTANKLGN